MRPRRSKTTTGNGRGTASVAFRGWTYRRAALRRAESVGEVIDACCPQSNEVAALYLIHASEGVLPFRKKVSPNALFAPFITRRNLDSDQVPIGTSRLEPVTCALLRERCPSHPICCHLRTS